jgi:hypothetical protein
MVATFAEPAFSTGLASTLSLEHALVV